MTMQILQPPGLGRGRRALQRDFLPGRRFSSAARSAGSGRGEWHDRSFAGRSARRLKNILDILAQAGGRPEHSCGLTRYVLDRRNNLASLLERARYRELMGRHYPTMAVVQVSGLVENRCAAGDRATAVIPEEAG